MGQHSEQLRRTSNLSFRKQRQIVAEKMLDIWCIAGHIGLQQVAIMRGSPSSNCKNSIVFGQMYTLVIEMHFNEQQMDFLLEECLCNQLPPFVGNGCLHRSNLWVDMTETVVDRTKFVLIHFVAPAISLHFECRARVYQCFGCCQNVCNRSPPVGIAFPSTVVPLSFSLPLLLPPPASPPVPLPPLSPPVPPLRSSDCFSPFFLPFASSLSCSDFGLPIWAFWLILFLIVLLFLLFFCCLLSLCYGIAWRFRDKIWPRKVTKIEEIRALPPLSPVPSSHSLHRTVVVNESSQTMPQQIVPWDSEWEAQQNQRKKGCETERHVEMPLRDLANEKSRVMDQMWWRIEEETKKEEEEIEETVRTEWREEGEEKWRRSNEWVGRDNQRGGRAWEEAERQRQMEAERQRQMETERQRQMEGQRQQQHYVTENWSRPAVSADRFHLSPTQWTTHFGKEPMAGVLGGEEEERMEWRTTEANGGAVREGGMTKYRQKSTF
ncbi:hypothetical protein niasHS_007479 [Heterodera schachtii]|uniref:Uncharacterized protein n=1 Tax=Heterodera schachtii TaxID=97005 RepID=A0ABD2JXX0_HETSC